MSALAVPVGTLLAAAGLVAAVVAVPLMARAVPPNRYFGLAVGGGEAKWLRVNARVGRRIFVVGMFVASAGLATRLFGFDALPASLATFVGGYTFGTLDAFRITRDLRS